MIIEKIATGVILGSALTYFGFTQEMVWIFSGIMALDFIFGVIAKWIYRPEQVESKAAVKGITRKIGIFMLPFIVVIGGKVLGTLIGEQINFFFLASVCMGVLIMQELYSLVRHIYNISSGEHLPEYEVAQKIMRGMSNFFRNTIDSKTDDMMKQYDEMVGKKKK